MYLPIPSLLQSSIHQSLVRSLYRSLLRNSAKLARIHGPQNLHHPNPQVLRQCQRYELNPKLYLEHLAGELKYEVGIQVRMPFETNAYTGNVLHQRLQLGVEMDEALENVILKRDNDSLAHLIQLVVSFRSEIHKKQAWREQYLTHSDTINEVRNRKKPALFVKRLETRSLRKNQKLKESRRLELPRHQSISRANELLVLQRYLKSLQTDNLIPNPYLLPYTDKCYHSTSSETYPEQKLVPGATKMSSIQSAYDMEYVESIIKPSFEYDINSTHFVQSLDEIVNNKGPYPVTLSMNNSGTFLVPLLRRHNTNAMELRRIALDIKNLTRLTSLLGAWNSGPNQKSIEFGPINRDGSITVKGSQGFGHDERVFPKYYYEDLCLQEAKWEYLMGSVSGKDSKMKLKEYVAEWMEPLDSTTPWIKRRLTNLQNRYLVNAKMFERQRLLQGKQNAHYDKQVARYRTLMKSLGANNVFKHSDLVNADRQKRSLKQQWVAGTKNPKIPTGGPVLERRGMGKTLGDYLEEIGYHNFKWGKRFVSRFKRRRRIQQ